MNLVEELRKVASLNNHGCVMCDTAYNFGVDDDGGCNTCADTMNKIADLIEKYYYPKQNPMVGNNKCNAEQYDEIVKHISALLWLNDNGGWEAVSKRLMPEGYEWPRFEDESFVMLNDKWDCNGRIVPVDGVAFKSGEAALVSGAAIQWKANGERFKRPEPKVVDADGVKIEVGDTVWHVRSGYKYKVKELPKPNYDSNVVLVNEFGIIVGFYPESLMHEKPVFDVNGERIKVGHTVHVIDRSVNSDVPFTVLDIRYNQDGDTVYLDGRDCCMAISGYFYASSVSRKKPVKGADGKLIKSGEIVYGLSDGKEWRVTKVTSGSHPVEAVSNDSVRQLKASWLTHEKVDTQADIDVDVMLSPEDYCNKHGLKCENSWAKSYVKYDHLFNRQRKLCVANKCV